MKNSFVAEMDKLRRRPATWVLIAVWTAMSVIFAFITPYVTSLSAPADQQQEALSALLPAQMIGNVISGFPVFGGAIALVLGALVVGSEFSWGTLETIFVQRPSRTSVWSGKLLALAVVVFALVLATFIPGAVSSYTIATIENAPVNWPPVWDFARALAVGWLILTAWAGLGAVLATLLRNSALAIGLGVAYLLIERLIAALAAQSALVDTLSTALLGINAGSLVAGLGSAVGADTPGIAAVVGPTQATLVLAAYVMGSALLSMLIVRKRDVT